MPGRISPQRAVPANIPRPEYVGKAGPRDYEGDDIYDTGQIEQIREAGKIAADAIEAVALAIVPGATTDELDRMQSEADGILRDTLQCFEHGAINEGALAAFNIALQQFHNAVADRKALLLSMPQSLQRSGAQLRATATL